MQDQDTLRKTIKLSHSNVENLFCPDKSKWIKTTCGIKKFHDLPKTESKVRIYNNGLCRVGRGAVDNLTTKNNTTMRGSIKKKDRASWSMY